MRICLIIRAEPLYGTRTLHEIPWHRALQLGAQILLEARRVREDAYLQVR